MGSLLNRYYHNLRRHRKGYVLIFVVVALVVIVGLMAYSTVNANFNKSLRLDDPEVNPQDYNYFSKMFFAGYALYSDTKGEDGAPLVVGYQYQTREQARPMHKMMNVCFSSNTIRHELLKLSGMEGYKYSDFEVQISEYGSMCYRFHVFSRNLELAKEIGYVMEKHMADIMKRELGITYVRATGWRTVKTDQPMPPHYLYRINDSRSQSIAEEAMNERPEALQRRVFGKAFCLAAGLGLGFLVVLILLVLSEYFSNAIYKPEQVQEVTERPFLASIPYKGSEKAYKVLAKTVITGNGFGKILLMAGCKPTNKIYNGVAGLARALADEGKKVLLLNLSSEKDGLDDYLKLKKDHGISDIHQGEIEVQHPAENLDAVSAGSDPSKLEEACESEAFMQFFAEMGSKYDYILCYDTNITQSPQAISFMKYADVAMLALEYDGITKSQLRITLERLDMLNVERQSLIMLNALS